MSNIKRKSFDDPIGLHLPETGKEFLEMLEENSEFEEVPHRIKAKELFISICKGFAACFEYEILIKELEHEVKVILEIDTLIISGESKDTFFTMIGMADEIGMNNLKEGKTTLSLVFFTHQLYLNGKPMRRIKGVE